MSRILAIAAGELIRAAIHMGPNSTPKDKHEADAIVARMKART